MSIATKCQLHRSDADAVYSDVIRVEAMKMSVAIKCQLSTW